MGKKRKSHQHLPPRVYENHGRYFYVNKQNKWINLGKTLKEAMVNWLKIVEPNGNLNTMGQLFDRYMVEVAPSKAAASYKSNLQEIKALREAFSNMTPQDVDSVIIYKFMDARGKTAPTTANREKALLSHVFTKAIRWGVVKDNPCRNVESIKVIKRDRYITNKEFESVLNLSNQNIQNIMKFAYLTGLRQADILKLKLSNLLEHGIYVEISKSQKTAKKKIIINWTSELTTLVNDCIALANEKKSEYLFSNNKGLPFSSSGFQSNWQKLIRQALGYNYELLLIRCKLPPDKNELAFKSTLEKYPNTPMLFLCAENFYLWGRSTNGDWRLIELSDANEEQAVDNSLKKSKEVKLLNDNYDIRLAKHRDIPIKLYEKIESLGAHYSEQRVLDERFTFHDIRRKTATDVEAKSGREKARKLLGHSDQRMTEHYISGAQIVDPHSTE